jgi:stage III sporulation protein AB
MGGSFLKWIGAIAFLVGVCCLAYRLFWQVSARCREMEMLLRFFHLLHRQIADYDTPLPEIFAKAQAQELFSLSLWQACERDGIGAAFAAREASFGMPQEVCAVLLAFFSQLGKSTRAVQLESCVSTLSRLEAQAVHLQEEAPKKKKLCLTVSVCIGLSVLILLL